MRLHDSRLFTRGKSRYIWARIHGERVSTRCTDERAATLWADEEERKRANPRYAAAAEATLGPCVRDYFAELKQRKSSAGTTDKETRLAGHLVRLWGEDLKMDRLQGASGAVLVEGLIKSRESEGAKPITVHMLLGTLRGVLTVAKHHGLWRGDLAEVMPIRYTRRHKPRSRAPSPEEVAKLLQNLRKDRAAHVAYIVATGGRISESFRARRDDTSEARGIVHVWGTKTGYADDDVPITSVSRPWLDYALKNAPGKAVLFNPWGKYWRDIVAACKRAEIPKVTPNDLRRAFGHWHKLAGAHIPDVARMLRHGDDKLAQTTYARIGGEQLGDVVGRQLAIARAEGTKAGVLELPATTPSNDDNDEPPRMKTTENLAPPAEVESATLALGKPRANPREIAGKQAWARRNVRAGVLQLPENNLEIAAGNGGSSEPNGSETAIPPWPWSPGRVFRIDGPRVIRLDVAS